ncbi:MAG: hypothetical protein FJ296_07345 [Planctomycetes bacterium]|nr:hypothetical protein [Planctomycetota bacterium]
MKTPIRARRSAALALLALLAGCTGPLLDQPGKQRRNEVVLPPLFWSDESPDGSSWSWDALFWLVGRDVEGERRHARALPLWWHDSEAPYVSRTLVFPLWYERESADTHTRFWSLLYGRMDGPETTTHYVLPPLFWMEDAHDGSYHRSGLLLAWDEMRRGAQRDVTVVSLLGLATGLRVQSGLPPEGEAVGDLGRASSRRVSALELLGLVSAFGWDDVGDRRDIRVLTLLSSEPLSLFRSWRGRGEDPFVREWLFPLYMNRQDADGGWSYVGPLWGEWSAGERRTDWWALGLLARTRAPEGDTWRVLGLPVWGP